MLQLKGIYKTFNAGTVNEKRAIDNLNLTLEDGDFVTIIGGNGAGKSTTLNLIAGVYPDLLLLDEHTAALDPKTADKVLQITEEIVARDNLTTLMVTHNMKNAIQYGNRLIMMDAGRVVVDIRGEEKKNLTVRDLLEKFNIESDRMLLSE